MMNSSTIYENIDNAYLAVSQALSSYPNLTGAVICSTVLLLTWRLYRFTVLPALWASDEPRELPYWIPCQC